MGVDIVNLPVIQWKPINTIMYELTTLIDYLNEFNIGHLLGLNTDFSLFQLCVGTLVVAEVVSIFSGWGYEGDLEIDEPYVENLNIDDAIDLYDISSASEFDFDDEFDDDF